MRKICCFSGHGDYPYNEDIRSRLYEKAEELILSENVTEFWVGNYGGFDLMATGVIKRLKHVYPHVELNIVVPYLTRQMEFYINDYREDYDNILMADIPPNTPRRLRIIKCNEYMVKSSAFMICFVNRHGGGAAQTLEYAQRKKHIKILNIANG